MTDNDRAEDALAEGRALVTQGRQFMTRARLAIHAMANAQDWARKHPGDRARFLDRELVRAHDELRYLVGKNEDRQGWPF